jgi:hypothetical protein
LQHRPDRGSVNSRDRRDLANTALAYRFSEVQRKLSGPLCNRVYRQPLGPVHTQIGRKGTRGARIHSSSVAAMSVVVATVNGCSY